MEVNEGADEDSVAPGDGFSSIEFSETEGPGKPINGSGIEGGRRAKGAELKSHFRYPSFPRHKRGQSP